MIRAIYAGFLLVTALSIGLAGCSGPGGNASAMPHKPGAITFTGTSITDNVMTLPCDTDETFNVSQVNYSGSFTLTSSSEDLSITPTSGTSTTSFTAYSDYGESETWTVTATGGGNVTGMLTVDYSTEDCG